MASLSTKKGKTRGKNPRDIEYQAFDLEKPDTLPKTIKEFMEATGMDASSKSTEPELVELLVNGFNDSQYSAASDEIGEFINDAWDKDTQSQFRLAVRNYSKLSGMTIEEAVTLIKPGTDKGWDKKVLAKQETEKNTAGTTQSASA